MERTDQPTPRPTPQERVAALHREAAADYAAAQTSRAGGRDQLAFARIHGNEQAANL
jgi:hypothetical protein